MRVTKLHETVGILLEVSVGAALVAALVAHAWLIAALVVAAFVLRTPWEGHQPAPEEVAYWTFASAMALADYAHETAVLFLLTPFPLVRMALMLSNLSRRNPASEWEDFYLDLERRPKLEPFARFWRGQRRGWHRCAWIVGIAEGLAWTAGLFWVAYRWDSPWSWPFRVITAVFAAWWLVDVIRRIPRRALRVEAAGFPAE